MKRLIFILTFTFSGLSIICSQNTDIIKKLESRSENGGSVHISQSDKIAQVLYLHLQAQKKNVKNNGWRICVFADSGQEANRKAENIRSIFLSRFKGVQPHKVWNYPFYRVYVGDFRSKSEALRFLKIIEREFPNAYIIPDVISQSDLN